MPMTGEMEINLDAVDAIECGQIVDLDMNTEGLETVTVKGGILTLKSSNTVRYGKRIFMS